MAETINIAKMAEKLSTGIFREFLWGKCDHTNINWTCERQDEHEVKTHPSDVVFWYDEPYSLTRTYVNCDLKSYASGTITANAVQAALESLAKSLSCAEISPEFNETYIHQNVTPNIHGLLFVYNHDSGYDKDFSTILEKVNTGQVKIPRGSKIVVLGPQDIFWLNNVHYEISYLRGAVGLLPDRDHCKFYYPNLIQKKNVQMEQARAATLETLTGPWMILSYHHPKSAKKGFVVFMRRRGHTVEEFLYLIDYLMHFQVLGVETQVTIRMLDPSPNSTTNFSKAKTQYVAAVEGGEGLMQVLNAIELGKLENVHTSFCEKELSRQ